MAGFKDYKRASHYPDLQLIFLINLFIHDCGGVSVLMSDGRKYAWSTTSEHMYPILVDGKLSDVVGQKITGAELVDHGYGTNATLCEGHTGHAALRLSSDKGDYTVVWSNESRYLKLDKLSAKVPRLQAPEMRPSNARR